MAGYADPQSQSLPFQGEVDDTSHEAAVAAKAFAPQQRERYFTWLKGRGDRGGTDHEAHVALGISRSSICARRAELMAAGRVLKVVGKKRNGLYQARLQVWRVALTT